MDKAATLFAERGYGNVGINEVGETAGFGKGGLYYHIRSKEDLLVSIISEHMEQLITDAEAAVTAGGTTPQKVAALTRSFAGLLCQNAAAMTLSYRDIHSVAEPTNIARIGRLHSDYRQIWAAALAAGADAGEHRHVAAHEIEAFLALLFASVFWFGTAAKIEPEALSATLTHMVVSAVTTPHP